nr:Uncharacterised protein [Raoultella sp. NCTC 9187]
MVSRGARRVAEHPHEEVGHQRFTEDDNRQRCQHRQRLLQQDHRVEQHADGNKEQHRERVAKRQPIVGGAVAELGFVEHHAGEKGARGQRRRQQFTATEGNSERQRQHRKRKQFARAGRGAAR